VQCHRLLLAAACPILCEALLTSASAEEDRVTVFLPDASAAVVAQFVQSLYAFLSKQCPDGQELAQLAEQLTGVLVDKSFGQELKLAKIPKNEQEHEVPDDSDDVPEVVEVKVEPMEEEEEEPEQQLVSLPDDYEEETESDEDWEPDPDAKKYKNVGKKFYSGGDAEFDWVTFMLESLSQGQDPLTLNAEVSSTPFDWAELSESMPSLIIGLHRGDYGVLRGTPLAWPNAAMGGRPEHFDEQFERVNAALKGVFGASRLESGFCLPVVKQMEGNLGKPSYKRQLNAKRVYAPLNEERLKQELGQCFAKFESAQVKPYLGFELEQYLTLEMRSGLRPECLNGVAICTFTGPSEVKLRLLNVREDRWQWFQDFFTCLSELWLYNGPKYLPDCANIREQFETVEKTGFRVHAARCLLEDNDGSLRKELLSKRNLKMCEGCGEYFPTATNSDAGRFQYHQLKCVQLCDCKDVHFDSTVAKERHIKLFHKKDFVKCDMCKFICKKGFMPKHIERKHTVLTCKLCGQECTGSRTLANHMTVMHSQVPNESKKYYSEICEICGKHIVDPEKMMNHMGTHRAVTCKICGLQVKNGSALISHKRKFHAGEFKCDKCGKVFKQESYLKSHILNVHTDESEKPYQCPKCPRR